MTCLPCLLKNYEVQCAYCNKGYCHRCFRRDYTTGWKTCSAPATKEWDTLTGKWYALPGRKNERHSFRYLKPEPENINGTSS